MTGRKRHSARHRTYQILERGAESDPVVHAFHALLIVLIMVNVAAVVLESVPSLERSFGGFFTFIEIATVAAFTVEYGLRLWSAPEHIPWRHLPPWRARLNLAIQPQSIIDLLAILPFYLAFLDAAGLRAFLLLRLFRFFKLARYSPGLASLVDSIYSERRALAACAVILAGTVLLAASAMNFAEAAAQPDKFGTIPDAMYWAVVTLTTVGYGDVVPVTPLGRIIAGLTAVGGLIMLALPVGIIASAFAREIHRHDFVVTWGMVARVPLFAELEASEIAGIMRHLRSQSCAPAEIVVRKGEAAHSMYFIAAGEVEVELPHEPVRLGPGDFFGEISLLKGSRRNATVKAVAPSRLLVLDADDLHHLMERNPRMARHIKDVAEARTQPNNAEQGNSSTRRQTD